MNRPKRGCGCCQGKTTVPQTWELGFGDKSGHLGRAKTTAPGRVEQVPLLNPTWAGETSARVGVSKLRTKLNAPQKRLPPPWLLPLAEKRCFPFLKAYTTGLGRAINLQHSQIFSIHRNLERGSESCKSPSPLCNLQQRRPIKYTPAFLITPNAPFPAN